ncbi:histidine kinase [Metarhizobium album]|uniref:histidine kinase n=2 Tax=Metarhizobium album TaxID=2182425 RepID=A0A2U2DKW3_9HYPH|nr:histidine kinase [Rhizobium album]
MRKRLMAVAATALLPAIGLLAYNEFASRERRSAEIHSEAAAAARMTASEVERILEGSRSLLIAVSALPAVVEMDAKACGEALSRVATRLTTTGAILLIDTNGKLVCDSQGNGSGTDFSDRSYVEDGLAAKDLVVGGYTVSKLTGVPVLPVALSVYNDDKLVGVIATGIRLDWLQARIIERGVARGGAVTIADHNGVILARNPYPERFVGTRIPDPYQHLITSDEPGTVEVKSQDGTERILGYIPTSATNQLYVSAGFSQQEAFAEVNRLTFTAVIMLSLGAVLAFVAATLVGSRFILKPIAHIVDVMEKWRQGDTAVRTNMAGKFGELGLVGGSVDTLLDELERRRLVLEAAEERRSLLARELTHRVKNTLALVSAIARQTFKSYPLQVNSFIQRLASLGSAYDLLFAAEHQSADIRAIVERTLRPHLPVVADRVTINGPECRVDPDIALALSLVIHELSTNAVKYGALRDEQGLISINWSCDTRRVSLLWREHDGPPVLAPEKEGFGSRLIRRAFPAAANAEVIAAYLPDGLQLTLAFDLQCADVGIETG